MFLKRNEFTSIVNSNENTDSSFVNCPVNNFTLSLLKKSSHRKRHEQFIHEVFKNHYNVSLESYYPELLSIESNNKHIRAVAGIRCASQEKLFSEYYLEGKLLDELQKVHKSHISRQTVVEVGNLAPASAGQMRWLITSITAFLYASGYKYIIFTAIPSVYNAFERMNLPVTQLNEAKQHYLPENIKHIWGDQYYKYKPMVLTGDIAHGYNLMRKNISHKNKNLSALFESSYLLGQRNTNQKLVA